MKVMLTVAGPHLESDRSLWSVSTTHTSHLDEAARSKDITYLAVRLSNPFPPTGNSVPDLS
jgi:hypothetical protein